MIPLPTRPGGWWHEYVCPVHGTELLPPSGPEGYPCPHGCLLSGEPYDGAWTVFAHQAAARRMRLLAYQGRVEEALAILEHYVLLYAELEPGQHEGAKAWMVPGRLFQQALTESIWTVSVADAVWTLAGQMPAAPSASGSLASGMELLGALRTTAVRSRELLAESNGFRSNYVAWFNAADALVLGAVERVSGTPPPYDVVTHRHGIAAHAAAAVLPDGWEWEGSTYYHQFVLRAYLLALKGRDPASLPAEFGATVLRMLEVLSQLATAGGVLPQLHDSPYDRTPQAMEYLELAVLARQFAVGDGLAAIETWARRRLTESHDGLEDHLANWFSGKPPSADPAPSLLGGPSPSVAGGGGLPFIGGPGSCFVRGRGGACDEAGHVVFPDAGYAVLRSPDESWSAVVDFGPHGGSHGHRDKLALYLYGTSSPWQPDYGVTPYGSRLRHDFYAATVSHPTFAVDGAEQRECAGRLVDWAAGELCVECDQAYDGVVARRHLVMTSDYLLDVLLVECAEPRLVTLQFRPGVPLEVTTRGSSFRTTWRGTEQLHGVHKSHGSEAVVLVRPGLGPADDPVRPHTHVDWQLRGTLMVFASAFMPDGDLDLELRPGEVTVTVAGRLRTHRTAG